MDDSNTLSDNVFLENEMPLKIIPIDNMPSDSQFVHMNSHNEKVLSQVMALDSFSGETEEDSETSADIVRMEHKLNLLLDMVGILVSKDSDLPSKKKVIIYSEHIDWIQPRPFAEATIIELKIWLRPDYPKALHLYVHFENTGPLENAYLVRTRYLGLNECVVMQLEKLIFRHHRRVIAQSRLE